MKKVLLSVVLLTSILTSFLFTSCEDPSNFIDETPVTSSEIANSCWFAGDVELQFPEADETLYIKYLPDTLNVTKWISLKENENQTYTATIEWSENIREIGRSATTLITKKNGLLNVRCEFFNLTSMASYAGVTASNFDVNQVPALQSEYLSNFAGTYTLNTTNYTLSVGAKLGISKSVSEYWNANVLNTEIITNKDGTYSYDLLLAHSSANNGAGSIDPGITGNEPFISQQGLFWSHMTITPANDHVCTIKWNSEWKNSPYEALETALDMTDKFTGPETLKIKYIYNFYFGNPAKDEAGWCTVDRGELIGTFTEELDIPTTKNWKQILEAANLTYTIPEGKIKDYWWYSTNSITSIESSYVYPLSNSTEPSLNCYDFYLALKDKPEEGKVYYQEGTFARSISGVDYSVTVTKDGITYNGVDYEFVSGATWGTAKDGVSPLQYCYLLSNGECHFYAMIEWYTNNLKSNSTTEYNTYINFREPKETTEISDATKGSKDYTIFGTRRATLNKQ